MTWSVNQAFGASRSTTGQNTTTNQTQTQQERQNITGSGVTTTLDPASLRTLQSVVASLAPKVGVSSDAEAVRALSGQLSTNLDPALVEANIRASQQAAIRNFNLNTAPQIANFQQQVGSKGNTFSQLIAQQGNIDLSSSLMQIALQGQLQAAAQRSADLGGAIQGYGAASNIQSQPLQQLLAAISTLTGARTETQTKQQSLSDVVAQLNSNTYSSSTTRSRGYSFGGEYVSSGNQG